MSLLVLGSQGSEACTGGLSLVNQVTHQAHHVDTAVCCIIKRHETLFVLQRTGAPAAAEPATRKAAEPDGQSSSSETSCDDIAVTGSQEVKKVVKSRRKFRNELTTRLIAAARAALAAPETGQLPL